MIPVDEIKAAIDSPLCDELARWSPSTMFHEVRRLRYGASDQNLSDWDWLTLRFHVNFLFLTGYQDGWRGAVSSSESYNYHGTNKDIQAGQIAGRAAHKAVYGRKPVDTGGIREGI